MGSKIANVRTVMESIRTNPNQVGGASGMALALQRANAKDGTGVAEDGRMVAKFMPNKKGYRIVNGEYVPRKQK